MSKIDLNDYFAKIDEYTDNGSLEQAIYHCLYLLRQFPRMYLIYEKLGRAFLEMDNYSAAYDVYTRLCSARPDQFLHHISLSYIYSEYQMIDQAVEHCELALSLQPGNKSIYTELARLLSLQGKTPEADIQQLSAFSNALHYYNDNDYAKASQLFASASETKHNILTDLFLGLSLFNQGQPENGMPLIRDVLSRSAYVIPALRASAIYYLDRDKLNFYRMIERLGELDPYYSHWEIHDGQIFPQTYPIAVSFFDWTGFPNTRIRVGWQQSGEKLIQNDLNRLPAWLTLIPSGSELFSSELSEEAVQKLHTDNFDSQISDSQNEYFQKDYFRSKSEEVHSAEIKPKVVNPSDNTPDELDQAFSYLEKVVNEGILENQLYRKVQPDPQKEAASNIADSEYPEYFPAEDPDPAELEEVRKAWNCFSTGKQQEGVQLYKALIANRILPAMVEEDIEKLCILFPDNEELSQIADNKPTNNSYT